MGLAFRQDQGLMCPPKEHSGLSHPNMEEIHAHSDLCCVSMTEP